MMNGVQYSEPVKKLITHGSPKRVCRWPNYSKLGILHRHIPELIVVLSEEQFTHGTSARADVWAPLHAWRALGQLQATEAIPALISLLYRIDTYGDDWVGDELPDVFAMIGSAAIPKLTHYLAGSQHSLFARVCAAQSLAHIGLKDPDVLPQCIDSLEKQLKQYSNNHPILNGSLVNNLIQLQAITALATIQYAYQRNCVDLSIVGDCKAAIQKLRGRSFRSTP